MLSFPNQESEKDKELRLKPTQPGDFSDSSM
jgi:hypothetical protein